MTIAKLEFNNKKYFERIKASIDEMKYMECCICGTIRVDVKDLVPILNSLIAQYEKDDEYFCDLCSEILHYVAITERYDLDGEETYDYIDEVIIFFDMDCDCFGKSKIKREYNV
jgi:hypothetical protein